VDNFQGEQADVVIVSLVRSNTGHQLGFLKQPQRINVLLSRARHGLILLGNEATLRQGSARTKAWDTVLRTLPVFSGFPACCEVHNNETLVPDAAAFARAAPNGGCAQVCGVQMTCGHPCTEKCHARAMPHPPCHVRVPEHCPVGHAIERECSSAKQPACKAVVAEHCPAGHPIDRICSADKQPVCKVEVLVQCAGAVTGDKHELVKRCHVRGLPFCQLCDIAKSAMLSQAQIEAKRVRYELLAGWMHTGTRERLQTRLIAANQQYKPETTKMLISVGICLEMLSTRLQTQ
jgi:hypothetical protein